MGKPTERFSDRVSNYVRYRPSYPQALVDTLMTECHLDSQSTIADVGSGTGIFPGCCSIKAVTSRASSQIEICAKQQSGN